MHVLADRWPALATIPRTSLAHLPTPISPLLKISERLDTSLWVKRDDLTSTLYGGNKARKLEYVLARALERGADTLVTAGTAGSRHVFATALFGRAHGFATEAVLTPQRRSRHAEERLRATLAVGARLHPAHGYPSVAKAVINVVVRLRLAGRRPYVIPVGGASVHGMLGYVNAGVELAQQIDAGECPDPASVYVSCGSSATVAGLALGLAAAGVKTRVVGVRVADALLANRLRVGMLTRKVTAFLREVEPRFPDVAERAAHSVHLDADELGHGVGQATPTARAAARLFAEDGLGKDGLVQEGMTLDATYAGKAFACLLREAEGAMRGKRLIYVHTLSNTSFEPYLADAPPLPPELEALLSG